MFFCECPGCTNEVSGEGALCFFCREEGCAWRGHGVCLAQRFQGLRHNPEERRNMFCYRCNPDKNRIPRQLRAGTDRAARLRRLRRLFQGPRARAFRARRQALVRPKPRHKQTLRRWQHSKKARERVFWGKLPKDRLEFEGRLLIERDTPILDRVFISKTEALVVDANEPIFIDLYNEIYEKCDRGWQPTEHSILKTTYEIVMQHFSLLRGKALIKETERLAKPFYGDIKVSLGYFMRKRVGVCRHRALVIGGLLEMFKQDGLISGEISIDRNTGLPQSGGGDPLDVFLRRQPGAHAWCRYTSKDGTIWILDAMHEFFGKLTSSKQKSHWSYYRPDDEFRPGKDFKKEWWREKGKYRRNSDEEINNPDVADPDDLGTYDIYYNTARNSNPHSSFAVPYEKASHGLCNVCYAKTTRRAIKPGLTQKRRTELLRNKITMYCAWCKQIIYDSDTGIIYR